MKKKKKNKELVRNLVRITLILLLSLLVTFTLYKKEAKANNKIIEQTVSDAFAFQNIMMIHQLDPNRPNDYTDISTLETEDDTDSFISDTAIKTGNSQYYIRVNYGANCVTILTKDDKGNYTKPYKSMICSSGKSTPKSGTYKISYKYRWLSLYGGVYGQYSTRIVKNILFHSVPYFQQRADTLEYEEYDKLGTTASAGCIRLTVQDAKWIYDNITSGTYVEFYSDPNNPGPLGKPKAEKISSNTKNRGWDPTDPDINNPWNGGSGIPSLIYTTPKSNSQTTNSTKNSQEKNNNIEITNKEQQNTKLEKSNSAKENNKNESTQTKNSSSNTTSNSTTTQKKEREVKNNTDTEKNTDNNNPKNDSKESEKKETDSKQETAQESTDTSEKINSEQSSKTEKNTTPEESVPTLENNSETNSPSVPEEKKSETNDFTGNTSDSSELNP